VDDVNDFFAGDSCAAVIRDMAAPSHSSLAQACDTDISGAIAQQILDDGSYAWVPCDESGPAAVSDSEGFGNFDFAGYPPSTECTWVATCSEGPVTVYFDEFYTEQNADTVELHDGVDAAAPLIGTALSGMELDGSSLDIAPQSSSGSSMFIRFVSDDNVGAAEEFGSLGFNALVFCAAEHTSGTVSDICPLTCGSCLPGCEHELGRGLDLNTALMAQGRTRCQMAPAPQSTRAWSSA
jgi:hypothetical protein